MGIEFKNFGISFQDKTLFSGLNARLNAGQNLAILGCNGVGKSSFLKTIAENFNRPKIGITHDFKSFSYLSQNGEIRRDIPLTIREYIAFAKIKRPNILEAEIDATLSQFGISNITFDNIQNASGGQLMMARLARIELEQSELILLDEPFAPLDKEKSEILLKVITNWKSQNRCIIISIHDDELANGFDHFITLDGHNSFWEKKCAHHDHNCQFSHREYANSKTGGVNAIQ